MYILMRPLNKFVSAEENVLDFTALNFNGDNIIVDGRVLYLHDIRSFVETLTAEIREHITKELLFGLDIVDINWSPGVIHEEPRNRRVSYSVFDDPHNSFGEHRETLLKAILTDPRLQGVFHYVDQHNRIVWKAGPCFAYMDIAHKVEMKLFSCTQTTVGEPGRGTEVASHLVRNVAAGSIRNIFVMFQFLVMMGTFNKVSHLSERDMSMIRVPLPEVGSLWMLYLAVIRPLLVVWQNYFNGPRAAMRAKHCLFSGPHRAVTSSELSRYLSMHTFRLLGIKIPISLYRHIVTWFMNHNYARFEKYLSMTGRSVLAMQLGHGVNTHSLYASDSRLPSGIDFHRFFQTMLASAVWHDLLGYPPTLLDSMTSHQRSVMECSTNGVTVTSANIPVDIKATAAEVTKMILPEIRQMLAHTRANDLASFLDVVGIGLQTPASHSRDCVVSHVMHPSRLATLRGFMQDNEATFNHPHQALAVELIASGTLSILLIAPTGTWANCSTVLSLSELIGSGKTLPILLCASAFDGGKTTVLILPLLAMHDEYLGRAQKCRLTCETWSHRALPTSSPQLLLVAVEYGHWTKLRIYLDTLIRLGRLARVVVDEAHLLEKHAEFRECVNLLEHFGQLPTPIILMTATLPSHLEERLFSKVGRRVYRVLRRSTERAEIAHTMVPVNQTDQDMERSIAERIEKTAATLQKSERVLLFCLSRVECDRMADVLKWKPYHSDILPETRSEYLKDWRVGKTLGLVCTSMLNCCLDFPAVRFIFHVQIPRDAVDYVQAVGRVSRDGSRGESIVYFNPSKCRMISGEDDFGEAAIHDTLRDDSTCRRLRLALFLDGVAIPCAMLPGGQLCDVCDKQTSLSPPANGLARFPSGLLPATSRYTISPIEMQSGLDKHPAVIRPAEIVRQNVIRPPVTLQGMSCISMHESYNSPSMPETPSTSNLPNPVNHPAPAATCGGLFVAAQANIQRTPPTVAEDYGAQIYKACQVLAKSCVACWAQDQDYHVHSLPDCPRSLAKVSNPAWLKFKEDLRFSPGVCFYCCVPQKVWSDFSPRTTTAV
jgi:hypothetical protein